MFWKKKALVSSSVEVGSVGPLGKDFLGRIRMLFYALNDPGVLKDSRTKKNFDQILQREIFCFCMALALRLRDTFSREGFTFEPKETLSKNLLLGLSYIDNFWVPSEALERDILQQASHIAVSVDSYSAFLLDYDKNYISQYRELVELFPPVAGARGENLAGVLHLLAKTLFFDRPLDAETRMLLLFKPYSEAYISELGDCLENSAYVFQYCFTFYKANMHFKG